MCNQLDHFCDSARKTKQLYLTEEQQHIMTYYSLALILSCLSEFAKESLQQYVNKTWRIIQGKAMTEELNSTIWHIGFSHMMNLNWWNLQKHLKVDPNE